MFKTNSSKIILVFFAAILSSNVSADTITCSNMEIDTVYLEGPRDDEFYLQNKLVIKLTGVCAGRSWVHIGISHPAMNGFLSIALSAKEQNRKVSIAVNTSNQNGTSNQLAFIGIH